MVQGRCLCGTIRFEVPGPFKAMPICHCSMCRKHHGTLFVPFAVAPISGFRWISGEDAIDAYPSSPLGDRSFCRICGSAVPFLADSHGSVICPAGNLEGELGIEPDCHMFVASKAPWHEITEDLPQFPEYRPGVAAPAFDMPPVVAEEGLTLGSCLCGDVAYSFSSPPFRVFNCHCSRCRTSRGSAYATNLFVALDSFEWRRGESGLSIDRLPDARFFTVTFCRRCGSFMPTVREDPGFCHIPAGSLDTDPGARPEMHVFTADKAPWFAIDDSLPQFEEAAPRPG